MPVMPPGSRQALVFERLGHTFVAITADIYQQPTKKMAYDAALKIRRCMAGQGE